MWKDGEQAGADELYSSRAATRQPAPAGCRGARWHGRPLHFTPASRRAANDTGYDDGRDNGDSDAVEAAAKGKPRGTRRLPGMNQGQNCQLWPLA